MQEKSIHPDYNFRENIMNVNYKFIGWNTYGNSDKVWGVIYLEPARLGGKCVTFWGRRGKKTSDKIIL